MSAPATVSLTVSIVVYQPDAEWLTRTLTTLREALRYAFEAQTLASARVVLVDNGAAGADSPFAANISQAMPGGDETARLQSVTLAGHGNVGYGAGNNLAFAHAPADFHLILNPDVALDREAIAAGLVHLAAHRDCAMVTPVATAPSGEPLYLVKSYPSVFMLFLRGFAPGFLRTLFSARLAAYERADLAYDAPLADARIVSGCFMLVRGEALRRAGGFDPGYFLYFEDFDLSWRISRDAGIARVPACRIAHGGGGAARKGWKHIYLFTRSAVRFFRRNGWRL